MNQIGISEGSVNKKQIILISCILLIASYCMTFLIPFEMSIETHGYWYFAREWNHSKILNGGFRSPLYVLYISLFEPLGYPASINTERFVTSLFFIASYVFAFRHMITLRYAVFTACLFLPSFWLSEPNSQIWTFALIFSGFGIRLAKRQTAILTLISYLLLFIAGLNRAVFMFPFLFFAAFDAWNFFKNRRAQLHSIYRSAAYLAAFLSIAFSMQFFLSHFEKKNHPWNNAWFASTDWFPSDGKSMLNASANQSYNQLLVEKKYGSWVGKDFYFTNKELFNGAATFRDYLKEKPKEVFSIISGNALHYILYLPAVTLLVQYLKGGLTLAILVILGLLTIKRFRGEKAEIKIFWISIWVSTLPYIVFIVKERYLIALFLIYAFFIFNFAELVRSFFNKRIKPKYSAAVSGFVFILLVIMLTNSARLWYSLGREGTLKNFSISKAYPLLKSRSHGCNSIMTEENLFFAAFVTDRTQTVHDVWQLPPFYTANNDKIQKLLGSVDCIFVSTPLETETGSGTNIKIRYETYIRPLELAILKSGGTEQRIQHYGRLVRKKI